MVSVTKHGRCNRYQINTRKALRHPLESHCTVGKLLQMLRSGPADSSNEAKPEPAKKVAAKSTPTPVKPAPEQAKPASTVAPVDDVTPHEPEKTVVAGKEKTVDQAPAGNTAAESHSDKAAMPADKPSGKSAKKDKETPGSSQQGSLF